MTASAASTRPSSNSTPVQAPFSMFSLTARPSINRAPPCLAYPTIASTISTALSDTGKTRLPRSVLSGTPLSSNSAIISCGVKAVTALYRKRPFSGTLAINSSTEQLLVTLHRPLPVIITLRAGRGLRSMTVTACPCRAAAPAAMQPAAPPPMTNTFIERSPFRPFSHTPYRCSISVQVPLICRGFDPWCAGRSPR